MKNKSIQQEIKIEIKQAQQISITALVASIAFAALGLGLCVAGTGVGAIGVMISIPLIYFSYSTYQFSENLKDVINNTTSYLKGLGVKGEFSQDKVKKQLIKNTWCFEWATDGFIDRLILA